VRSGDRSIIRVVVVAITALDVAFMTAIAALVASVAAPAASILIARNGREHQRKLAREERGFDVRYVAYQEMLTEINLDVQDARFRVDAIHAGSYRVEAAGDADDETRREWAKNRARIATLASAEVVNAFETHADAQAAFWSRLVSIAAKSAVGDVLDPAVADELKPLLDVVYATRLPFEERIRADLRGSP